MTRAFLRRHLLLLSDDCAAAGMWALAAHFRHRARRPKR